MNENLDLTKILEGCEERVVLYSKIFGNCTFLGVSKSDKESPIIIEDQDGEVWHFKSNGRWCDDGECMLLPSKEQRDWNKFVKPIPIDTPIMCSDNIEVPDFSIRFYAGVGKDGHYTYSSGHKSGDGAGISRWQYMIPFDKFNPLDMEESLKYNIQK